MIRLSKFQRTKWLLFSCGLVACGLIAALTINSRRDSPLWSADHAQDSELLPNVREADSTNTNSAAEAFLPRETHIAVEGVGKPSLAGGTTFESPTYDGETNAQPVANPTDEELRGLPGEPSRATFADPNTTQQNENRDRYLCGENLRRISRAALNWATNHGDYLPSQLISMKDELETPLNLICPSSPKITSEDWSEFDESKASYRIYSPGAKARGVTKKYVYCKVHSTQVILTSGYVTARIKP